jgi:hypothetical protein
MRGGQLEQSEGNADSRRIACVGITSLHVADERVAILDGRDGPTRDTRVAPLNRGLARQVASDATGGSGLTWTPWGRETVFGSGRSGAMPLWRRRGIPTVAARPPLPLEVPAPVSLASDHVRSWEPLG